MIKITPRSILRPSYIADSILVIDASQLRQIGVTHIVFDLDSTLVHHRTNDVSAEYVQSLRALKKAGFTILLGSNTRRDIDDICQLLDAIAVRPRGLSMKPFKSFYSRVAEAAKTTPQHIAMVGDHIINDAIGANRAGFTTILVKGLRRKTSLLYRTYLRFVLKRRASTESSHS